LQVVSVNPSFFSETSFWSVPRASPHNENFGALRSILRQLARSFLEIRQDSCEICEQSGHKLFSQSALVSLCGEAKRLTGGAPIV
jgi:hypothetical protein